MASAPSRRHRATRARALVRTRPQPAGVADRIGIGLRPARGLVRELVLAPVPLAMVLLALVQWAVRRSPGQCRSVVVRPTAAGTAGDLILAHPQDRGRSWICISRSCARLLMADTLAADMAHPVTVDRDPVTAHHAGRATAHRAHPATVRRVVLPATVAAIPAAAATTRAEDIPPAAAGIPVAAAVDTRAAAVTAAVGTINASVTTVVCRLL